uniref:EF-hand domain-containing protein n=1 Tax=Erythrolobus madagascarensis TaxID=708628 RepID=A0A7S0T9S1_9RHOD|mmetsp:Transcript_3533/g.7681  ORF Transcript_3533/g.7681 Transcript_3533/m.7681 type:complete len:170 (+) Transcript_3533:294-803(+)|eukprot:CAMPEP_0185846872 /NCGR_PEP_ID=MMETSP1354-20130828/2351_1 /TAXON_ID=708628 /ORGANISM="Erythrolobus madagascarensis, Strain CCMP3276" /LENGTH=169 /DNA_ID=CAMNT_0028547083 /DNA_START=287 /DNA_END=796 /DNA_ORIENTATION=+
MTSDQQLYSWFRMVDIDNSGEVDVSELQQALGQARMNFSLHACAMLIRMYDSKRSSTVNFNEFVGLHKFILSVQQSFARFDLDRNGGLDFGEVLQALQFNGFVLDMPAYQSAFAAFDPEKKGVLRMDDYIQLAAYLSASRSMFNAFDPQRTGAIHVNFSQFVYVTAHLR